jgi:hypothetical protein
MKNEVRKVTIFLFFFVKNEKKKEKGGYVAKSKKKKKKKRKFWGCPLTPKNYFTISFFVSHHLRKKN